VQKSHGEKPLFAADGRRVLYATATSEAGVISCLHSVLAYPTLTILIVGQAQVL
jgi:hypothetical protein